VGRRRAGWPGCSTLSEHIITYGRGEALSLNVLVSGLLMELREKEQIYIFS
jgi:hypothetical protein